MTVNIKLKKGGPYALYAIIIDAVVTKKSAGNYLLGFKDSNNVFVVKYIGRSDNDLNSRLKDHVDENYKFFRFSYAETAIEAYEEECRNFHDYCGSINLDNKNHPDKPDNASRDCCCPICGK